MYQAFSTFVMPGLRKLPPAHAIRGPAAGFFHTAVRTVRPCQVTSCGKPTLTDRTLPARRSMITKLRS